MSSGSRCAKCSQSIKKGSVTCNGYCAKVFCAKCFNLADYDLTAVLTKANLLFMCDDCLEYKKTVLERFECVLTEIAECKTIMLTREKEMREIMAKFEKFIVNDKKDNSNSYASVVKSAPPVIIKPKIKQDGKKTKDDIKKKVDPVDLKFTGIKTKQHGAVVIEGTSNEEQKKIKEVMVQKLGNSYEVQIPKVRKPRILIRGMNNEWSENEIVATIKKQNEQFLNEDGMKCVKMWKGKENRSYNAIIEVDHETFGRAIEAGKVNIGWDRCTVFDGTYVKRCFKCLGFNHNSTECKNKEVCARCLGEHISKGCTKELVEKCVNCSRANENLGLKIDCNHGSLSWQCPAYLHKLNVEKNKLGF